MSTLGKTFSKDPRRDKKEDLIAANSVIRAELLRLADVIRSQNERIYALDAGQPPLLAHAKNSPAATNDEAA